MQKRFFCRYFSLYNKRYHNRISYTLSAERYGKVSADLFGQRSLPQFRELSLVCIKRRHEMSAAQECHEKLSAFFPWKFWPVF